MSVESVGKNKIQTPCKFCIFAKWDKNSQIGCEAEKIETFPIESVIEVRDDEKDFYLIDGFCKFYRTEDWNNGKANKFLAETEMLPILTIVISGEDLHKSINDFKKLVDKIEKDQMLTRVNFITYYDNKFIYKKEIIKLITNTSIITALELNSELNKNEIEKEVYRNVNKTNGYFCIDFNSLTFINGYKSFHDLLNKKNKNIVVYENNKNRFILKNSLIYKDEKDTINEHISKILPMSKKQGVYFEYNQSQGKQEN